MQIAIASDQPAQDMKTRLMAQLSAAGHRLIDAAPLLNGHERTDYSEQVALSVLRRDAERGIIVSSRAVGASVAANRVPGIRAALCNESYSAYLGAKSEGMNVLVLALHALPEERMKEVIASYLEAPLAQVEVVGGLSHRRLQRVFEHVRDNVGKELSVAELAQVIGMSQYYFSKLFKASTGTTPHQYVMRQRVERAQELLRGTPTSLAEVATLVGFETQSHFTSVFRRLLGITPKRYREMHHSTAQLQAPPAGNREKPEQQKSATAA